MKTQKIDVQKEQDHNKKMIKLFDKYPFILKNCSRNGATRFKYCIIKAWQSLKDKYGIQWIVSAKRASLRISKMGSPSKETNEPNQKNISMNTKGVTITDIKDLRDYVYIPDMIERGIPIGIIFI